MIRSLSSMREFEMGFVKDVASTAAKVGTFGLAGLALSKNKKKPSLIESNRPMMTLSNSSSSMIGGTRRGM